MLACIYILNFFSPFRLTHDTIRYIDLKEWFETGRPADARAAKDYLPYGYVFFLLFLSKLQILKPFFIALIHSCYLLSSLWFIKKMFGSSIKFWQLAAFCLLNWTTIKFVITPLSEMQFLFFTMGGLYFFHRHYVEQKKVFLLWTLVFTLAAILTRTAGIVLLLAILLTLFFRWRTSIGKQLKKNSILFLLIISALALAAYYLRQFMFADYFHYFWISFRHNQQFFYSLNLKFHTIECASIFLNFPAGKIHQVQPGLRDGFYFTIGFIFLIFILGLLFNRKQPIPLEIRIYILLYMIVLYNWPYFEPRFWVPIVPLIIAIFLQKSNPRKQLLKFLLSAYKFAYIVVGLAGLSYYTYTSLNKKALATKQDAGIWRNEYETYFFGRPLNDSGKSINTHVLGILKKYN